MVEERHGENVERERIIVEASALLLALLFAFAGIGRVWEDIPIMIQLYGTGACFILAIFGAVVPMFSPGLFRLSRDFVYWLSHVEFVFFLLGLASLWLVFFTATQQFTSTAAYWLLVLISGFAVTVILTVRKRSSAK